MVKKTIIILCFMLTACANFAASVGGTFVGNIASDKVIKEMNKK
jgi:hypothetical protein